VIRVRDPILDALGALAGMLHERRVRLEVQPLELTELVLFDAGGGHGVTPRSHSTMCCGW
jgi:hypothetical protein